jgi:hypothetical protein
MCRHLIYVLTTNKSIRKVYICMVLKLLLHKNNIHFVDSYSYICYCPWVMHYSMFPTITTCCEIMP